MITTGSMGLTVWDQTSSPFDYGQLENNWQAIDQHDHTPGRGVQLGTGSIKPAAITQALLAPGSVGNAQLQAGSVSTADIQPGAITNALIAPGAVNGSSLANGSVGSVQIDPTLIPLGTIQQWWRPPGTGATPGGFWEIMDGRPWNSITNAWGLNTGNIPNMIGEFASGSTYANIGTTGGASSVNLAHSHTSNPHSHTIPDHTHYISLDGSHSHTFYGGLGLWSRENAVGTNVSILLGMNQYQVPVSYFTTYLQGLTTKAPFIPNNNPPGSIDGPVPMDTSGSHNHSGATQGMTSSLFTAYASDSGMSSSLGTVSTMPPNVSFAFIMRVR